MSFKRTFYKDLATLGSFSYLNQAIFFLSTVVVSRLLLPEEYGTVALIAVFTGFIQKFVDAGLSYEVIRTDYQLTYYKAINNLSVSIGVILYLVMLMLAYPIAVFYNDMQLVVPIIVMSFIFIPQTLKTVPGAILSKQMRFKEKGFVSFITTLITVALTIILAYLGASYWALIIPLLLSDIIALGVLSSLVDVARYYSLTFVVVVIPIQLYFGFYRTFNFPFKKVLNFWFPKVSLSILLIFSIWFNMENLKFIFLGLYGIHLLHIQRGDMIQFWKILISKKRK